MSLPLPLPLQYFSRGERLYDAAAAGIIEDVQHQLGLVGGGGGGGDIGGIDVVDVNWAIPARRGRTPICIASYFGHAAIVALLIQHGADVNKAGELGDTPLSSASCSGHTAIVNLLLQPGADVNKADKSGYTPLHSASSFAQLESVQILLNSGAYPHSLHNVSSS